MKRFTFAVLLAVVALAGCDRAKTNQVQTQPNKPASFRDTIFASVTPTADGGAYANRRLRLMVPSRLAGGQSAILQLTDRYRRDVLRRAPDHTFA